MHKIGDKIKLRIEGEVREVTTLGGGVSNIKIVTKEGRELWFTSDVVDETQMKVRRTKPRRK